MRQVAAQAPTAHSQQLCTVACIACRPAQPADSAVAVDALWRIGRILASHLMKEPEAGIQAVLLTLYPGSGAWL